MRAGFFAISLALVACSGGGPAPLPPTVTPFPTATQTPVTPTPTPTPVPATATPQAIETPFVLQTAVPVGPPNPDDPAFQNQTPSPTEAPQSVIRSGVPRFKWMPPAKKGEKSIVSTDDSGGQAGTQLGAWIPSMAGKGCYALLSARNDVVLAADPNGGLTTMYGPTFKCPNASIEFSVDYWAQSVANGGGMSPVLRFFDFVQNTFAGPSYDLRDPEFLGKYVRDFGLGHGPQMEVFLEAASAFVVNFQTHRWDSLYTGPPGAPSRNDGWILLPETHYPKGVICSQLPPLYVDNFQNYNLPIAGGWSSDSANLGATQLKFGDCFTAGGPGAYYEMNWPSWPNFGAISVRSLGGP